MLEIWSKNLEKKGTISIPGKKRKASVLLREKGCRKGKKQTAQEGRPGEHIEVVFRSCRRRSKREVADESR